MQVEKQCSQCGAVFVAEGRGCSRRRFCSRECMREWWRVETLRQRRKSPLPQADDLRECAICGKAFPIPRETPWAKYCSPDCAEVAEARRRAGYAEDGKQERRNRNAAMEYTCDYCGKSFAASHKRTLKRRTYCSPECRSKHGVQLKGEKYVPKPRPEPRVCEGCGKWFAPPRQTPWAATCSPGCCRLRIQAAKRAERRKKALERMASRPPMTAERRKYRRRQKYCGGNWPAAMEAARYRCQMCGSEDRDALAVHHRDGSGESECGKPNDSPNHALDNLIVLCKSCHSKMHKVSLVFDSERGWGVKSALFADLRISGPIPVVP